VRCSCAPAREVAPAAEEMRTCALVVTRRSGEAAAWLVKQLETTRASCLPFAVAGEHTLTLVRSGLVQARQELCGLVIGFGGASTMDTRTPARRSPPFLTNAESSRTISRLSVEASRYIAALLLACFPSGAP
jgi:hypothetical protein